MRTVILHYHLFKNAGTSLDTAFKDNFIEDKGEWVTKEFPAHKPTNNEQVKKWIVENPQAKCFSSHTALFPVPVIENVRVIPVLFIRNPIDRIASAYSFEVKQGGDGFGAVLARNTNLSGYIETRLALVNDRQCRNFHAQRLATMFNTTYGDESKRAKMALEALPFVGIVEKFSDSLVELETLLISEGFDDINLQPVERNVSRNIKKSLDEKMKELHDLIDEEVFLKLLQANELDNYLYSRVVEGCI
jgi:hypothetical protein